MLPPTRASKGGRGLSFSFLSCRRDCLRPPVTGRAAVRPSLSTLTSKKQESKPRPPSGRSSKSSSSSSDPTEYSDWLSERSSCHSEPHIKEKQCIVFASAGGHLGAPWHCSMHGARPLDELQLTSTKVCFRNRFPAEKLLHCSPQKKKLLWGAHTHQRSHL